MTKLQSSRISRLVFLFGVSIAFFSASCKNPNGTQTPVPMDMPPTSKNQDIPLVNLLSILNQMTNPPTDPTCSGNCPPGGPLDMSFSREAMTSFLKPELCQPLDFKSLCQQAFAYCRMTHGDPLCVAFEPDSQNNRFNSVSLRKNVFGYAQDFLERTINDVELQERCCNGFDQDCLEHFKSAELHVLLGLGPADRTGDYDPNTNHLEVSEAMLLNKYNEEGIEQLLLHELGHACEFSRRANHPEQYHMIGLGCEMASPGSPSKSSELTEADLRGIFSPSVADCVVDGLKAGLPKYIEPKTGDGACLTGWLREAFADEIFGDRRDSLVHWAWGCAGKEDVLHGRPGIYENCVMSDEKIQKALCPGGVANMPPSPQPGDTSPDAHEW